METNKQKKTEPFYDTGAWRRLRMVALTRDGGLCQRCLQKFRDGEHIKPNRARMVHHIIPVSERPDLALRLDNLMSICDKCHAELHPEKYEGKPAAERPENRHQARVIRV